MSKKLTIGTVCAVSSIIAILMASDADLRTNQQGLELIGNAESCRNRAYMCPANVITVGIGSTTNVKEGKTYTNEEIAAMWASDIKDAENCVNRYANGNAMNDNQFSAIASFTFNAGCGNLKASTLARYANRRKWVGMCMELKNWVYANGKKLNGLVKRRDAEYGLCMDGIKTGVDFSSGLGKWGGGMGLLMAVMPRDGWHVATHIFRFYLCASPPWCWSGP